MRKKINGFTLIELLAIIVILAIIAVITIPVILNVIESARRGAAIDSAYGYKEAIYQSFLTELSTDPTKKLPTGTYVLDENGILVNTNGNLVVNISGNAPKENSWVSLEQGEVLYYSLKIGDYTVSLVEGSDIEAVKNGEIVLTPEALAEKVEKERQDNAKELALNLASTKSGTGLYDVENGWTACVGGSVVGYSVKVTVDDIDYVVTKSDSESSVLVTKNTTTIASSIDSAKEVVNSLANNYLTSAYNANSGNTETVSLKVSEIGVDIPSGMDNNSWIYYNYDENATPKVSATEYSLKFTVGETNYTNTIVVNLKNSQVALDTTTNTLVAQKTAMPVDSNGYIANSYVKTHPVYFNPVSGEYCGDYEITGVSTDYKSANSSPEYNGVTPGNGQTSCLKWYAFSVNSDGSMNMILDHNTTNNIAWNSSNSTLSGPSKAFLYQLYADTSGWHSSLVRSDSYTASWTYNSIARTFTIDYSKHYASSSASEPTAGGVKARLITAQEVATITGQSNWSENTSTSGFYFDGSSSNRSAGDNAYAWLFDNTYDCEKYGCNVKDNSQKNSTYNYGYWSSSPVAGYDHYAWYVYYGGYLGSNTVRNTSYGLRPVITVSASSVSS